MDTDEAWDRFRNDSYRIQKASIAEKLDVLAAAINEMQTDTKRTAELVPQLMGDEAAIGAANSMAGPDMMGGGDPMAGGGVPGDDMMANNEEMPPMGGAEAGAGADMPLMGDMGAGEPAGEPPMEAPADMPPAEGGDMAGGDMESEEDYLSDEDIDALLEELYGGGAGAPAPEPEGMPGEGTPDPTVPTTGGGGLAEAAQNLVGALKMAAHEAVDQSDPDRVVQLAQIESEIMNILGPEVGAAVPDGIPVEGVEGEAGMPAGAPVDETGIAEEIAEDVAAEEAPGDMPPAEGGAPEGGAPEGGDDKKESNDKGEDKKEEKSDDKEEKSDGKESESTKKSATEDIPDDIMEFAETQDTPTIQKSDSGMPSMRDILAGKVNMEAFFKSGHEYVDDVEMYHQDYVDPIEQDCSMLKSEDAEKLASARNIFDWDFGARGQKDPDSISQAGEAQAALDHTGTTDPESISTADPIIAVTKSAEDITKPKAESGSTDKDSIAFAEKPQVALSHKGKTDPDSIADAEKAVEPGTGDDSEGTVERMGMGPISKSQEDALIEMIQKSSGDTEELRSIIKSIYNPREFIAGELPWLSGGSRGESLGLPTEEESLGLPTEPAAPKKLYAGDKFSFEEGFPGIQKNSAQGGKSILSLQELMSIAKSSRPSMVATVNGDIITNDHTTIAKSAKPSVRMGRGVDPMKVIENDLNEWNLFKANSR